MTPGKVLIVGASLAGSATAWHLHHAGWDVTIVDPTHTPPESYLLQLDETAQALLTAMHADHVAAGHSTVSPKMSFRWGARKLRHVSMSSGQARLGSRRDIVTAMHAHVPAAVTQLIGISVTALHLTAEGVTVAFDDHTTETYDIVIGADGLNSTVRALTHGPAAGVYRNGVSHVWFKADHRLPPDLAVLANRERMALQVYPYPSGDKTMVVAALELSDHATDRLPEIKARVAGVIGDLGQDLAPLARAIRAEPAVPFLTRFTQIRLPSWSTGRTVLIGDAAHCIDPLSGLGAHAALLDAAALADALRVRDTAPEAFAAYESRVRPFVTAAQAITARTVEYVTRPGDRTRLDAVLGGLTDLAKLAPRARTSPGSGRRSPYVTTLATTSSTST